MKTKYVCRGPVSPHANFLVNRFVGTVILLVKIAGGGKEKEPNIYAKSLLEPVKTTCAQEVTYQA